VPVDPGQRMDESTARLRKAASQKEPAIGDGSQSWEKRQSKSIRGSPKADRLFNYSVDASGTEQTARESQS
jgi:hypothetical protein